MITLKYRSNIILQKSFKVQSSVQRGYLEAFASSFKIGTRMRNPFNPIEIQKP